MRIWIFTVIITFSSVLKMYGQSSQIEYYNKKGIEFYNKSEINNAIQSWKAGLKMAEHLKDKQTVITFLYNIGGAYKVTNKYNDAIFYYNKVLGIAQEIGNKKIRALTHKNIGSIYVDLLEYNRAITFLNRSLTIQNELGNKEEIAEVLNAIGAIYSELGEYNQSLSFYNEALSNIRVTHNETLKSNILANIGTTYAKQNDYLLAIEYFEMSLKCKIKINNQRGVGMIFNNMGNIYFDIGDYQRSSLCYRNAFNVANNNNDQVGISYALGNLGATYKELGDYQNSIRFLENAFEITNKLLDNKSKMALLINLGDIYRCLGNYHTSLNLLNNAISIGNKIENQKGLGDCQTNIGIIYYELGDYDESVLNYMKALKIFENIGDKKGQATILLNIGVISYNNGDIEKAMNYYTKSKELSKEIGIHSKLPDLNIADIWLKKGKMEQAEDVYLHFSETQRLGKLNLIKGYVSDAIKYFKISVEKDIQNRSANLLFSDFTGLGQAFEILNKFQKAKENYENAVAMIEEQREGLGQGERANFFGAKPIHFKRIEPYEGMVRILNNKNDYNEAFYYAENLKARLLSEAIAKGQEKEEHMFPYRLKKEEQEYITQIRGLRKQMEALYKNKAMDIYAEKEAELKEVKEKQQVFISRLREEYPEYTAVHYPQPIKADEVSLNPNEVLIEFEVTEIATIVFLINNGKVETRRIDISRDSLQTLVTEYRGYFEDITQTRQLGKYSPEKGKGLYDLLFGDLLSSVDENINLVIVPDEFLGILPFEALVTELLEQEKIGEGEFGPFPLGVTYLADKYTLTYAQSATSLTFLRILEKDKVQGKNMLVVADPIFSYTDSRMTQLAQDDVGEETINLMGAISDWKQMGVAGIREREEERDVSEIMNELFPRLEKTEVLAQEIEALFGNKAIILSGSEAREDKVKSTDFSNCRYLTFATHGILDNTVPYIREPALVLNQVSNPEGYDGFLTMNEVMGMKLDAEVVALTACETGLGKNVSGEGVMGMGRAFQYAGARNVLVSLWSVAETSATELTAAFFKYVKEGNEPKEAIRLARSEIRRKGYEHPFYWASFVMYGK